MKIKNAIIQQFMVLLPIISALNSQPTNAASIYLENFETSSVGSIPTGWNIIGDATVRLTNTNNHTGLTPPWSTPDFGPSGNHSLAFEVAPGLTNTTAVYDVFSGTTGEFEFNWAFFYDANLSGLITFKLFGGTNSVDRDLLTTVTVDLGTSVNTMDMLNPQIHPGQENFTSFEVVLETDVASKGGFVYLDDISLEDSFDITPPTGNVTEFTGSPEVWEEHMVTYNATAAKCCTHLPNITVWNHTPEPGVFSLLTIGGVGIYFSRRRGSSKVCIG